MNYCEALDFIHSVSWKGSVLGLERISELCEKLGNPQNSLRFVHVAGTNGKGSFCAMLESVLRASGLHTGLFTSPYIRSFNERICFDGSPISESELSEITGYIKPFADSMRDKPTEFELVTAIGFEYFKRKKCDIVVLEAGLGGRLDSTNIISTPLLSVITGIALDHMAILGNTVEKIAAEKAGIIKCGVPVLYGGEDENAADVIRKTAEEKGAEFYRADYSSLSVYQATTDGAVFGYRNREKIKIHLLGTYQPRNAAVVLDAVDILRRQGTDILEKAVLDGLEAACWSGRFEIIARSPLTIFDGAHNAQGIASAVESIRKYFTDRKVYLLTGVMRDKDYGTIAGELAGVVKRAFTVTPANPRALDAVEYAKVLRMAGIEAEPGGKTVEEALLKAMKQACSDGLPLVCLGSLYMYGEIMDAIERNTSSETLSDGKSFIR